MESCSLNLGAPRTLWETWPVVMVIQYLCVRGCEWQRVHLFCVLPKDRSSTENGLSIQKTHQSTMHHKAWKVCREWGCSWRHSMCRRWCSKTLLLAERSSPPQRIELNPSSTYSSEQSVCTCSSRWHRIPSIASDIHAVNNNQLPACFFRRVSNAKLRVSTSLWYM